MLSRILLVLTLTAPLAVSAQYATIGPNGQVTPAGSTVIVVGSGTGPILNTPTLSFGTPAGTAGISLADRAGISNTSPAPTAVPSAPETSPSYSTANPPYTGQPVSGDNLPAPAGRLINNVGPSYYAGAGFAGGGTAAPAGTAENMASASLGDVAAQYKSSRPQNIRTYTNADAQRLSDTVNVRGANVNPVSAQNQPAAAPQPQLSASLRPSPSIRDETAQSSASAESSTAAATNEEGATTPQTSQPSNSAESNEQQAGNRLPATSTLLPLFGLLGIASGAFGLWLKKYRS